jgi:hypothetical protein
VSERDVDDRFGDRPAEDPASDDRSAPPERADVSDQDVRALVARLGRPHASGGTVIERAALLAAGADFDAAIAWILAHDGEPEARATAAPARGLYGARSDGGAAAGSQTPRRFVLPRGAMDA